jgi:hypothetical protein
MIQALRNNVDRARFKTRKVIGLLQVFLVLREQMPSSH